MINVSTDIAEVERTFLAEQRNLRKRNRVRQITLNVLGVLMFLSIWEILPRTLPGTNLLLFPPPSGIVGAFIELVRTGALFDDIVASLLRILIGFAIGSVSGIVMGLLFARIDAIRFICDPVFQGFRSIPTVALVPVAIIWFGIGEVSKVALISWGTFFPVWVATYLGARDVSPVLIRSARTLGANSARVLATVILPAAAPMIIAGLRQALAIAFIVLVAAELVGAATGIGQLIATAQQTFRIDSMFVGLFALGTIGFAADRVFTTLVARMFPWYGKF